MFSLTLGFIFKSEGFDRLGSSSVAKYLKICYDLLMVKVIPSLSMQIIIDFS